MANSFQSVDDADYYGGARGQYVTLPSLDDPESRETITEWGMQPGDAVLFHFHTVHGARYRTPRPRIAAITGVRHELRAKTARGLVSVAMAAIAGTLNGFHASSSISKAHYLLND